MKRMINFIKSFFLFLMAAFVSVGFLAFILVAGLVMLIFGRKKPRIVVRHFEAHDIYQPRPEPRDVTPQRPEQIHSTPPEQHAP